MNHSHRSIAPTVAAVLFLTLPALGQTQSDTAPASGSAPAARNGDQAAPATGDQAAKPEENKEKKEDEGPSWFEFYILGHGGYEYFNLMALHADASFIASANSQNGTSAAANAAGKAEFSGNGWCSGAGLGLRFLFIDVGLDYQYSSIALSGQTTDALGTVEKGSGNLSLHTLMLELDLVLPLKVLDLMLQAMFGYARASTDIDVASAFDSDGYAGRLGLALDIYLAKWVSLGAGGDVGLLAFYNGNARAGSLAVDAQARLVFHIN